MTILVTSIIDPRVSIHNRSHELLSCLAEEDDVLIVWPGTAIVKVSDLTKTQGVSAFFESERGLTLDEGLSGLALFSRLRHLQFDLLVNYNTLALGLVASLLAKRRGVPVVYDLADDLAEIAGRYVPPPLRTATKSFARSVVALNMRLADRVTCTTETLARAYGADGPSCTLIPNGVDTARFRPKRDNRRDPSSPIRLVFVGGLREWLDFVPVFKAIGLLKGRGYVCQFRIVGSGPEYAAIRRQATEMGVDADVTLIGPLPYEAVPATLASADIGILPFNSGPISAGALPLKLFEYMASGIPVVSSPLPEIQRVAGDIIWYAQTPTEYAEAIEEIAEGKYSHERLATGTRLVAERYSWQRYRNRVRGITTLLRSRDAAVRRQSVNPDPD